MALVKPQEPDGPAITGNRRLLNYIKTQLSADPRKWGAPKSVEEFRAAKILCDYKNAWAQDVRETFSIDPETGVLVRCTMADQDRMWADCMSRAEADIAKFMTENSEKVA